MTPCEQLTTYKKGCRCAACKQAYQDHYRSNRPQFLERMRRQHLKHRYGLTPEGYNKLLEYQDGGCAVCGKKTMNASGKRLAVDHCHASGRWRGLLCGRCNAALAWYEEFASEINDYLLLATRYRGYLPQHRDPIINTEI